MESHMPTTQPPTAADVIDAAPDESTAALRPGVLGTGGVTFLVVSAAAPLTVVAGTVPLAILIAGPSAAWAYLAVGLALVLFAVAFMALTREIGRAGGFYAYVAATLGRVAGLGAGVLALVSYNAMQIGIYGLFAVSAQAMLSTLFGVDVPWGLIVLVAIVAVWALGFAGIDLGAKVLGVFLIAETILLAVLVIGVLAQGGAGTLAPLAGLSVEEIFSPGFAVTLGLAFGAFIGFEATVLYRREARDAHRTVPRATYLAVISMTVFYAVIAWVLVRAAGSVPAQALIAEVGVPAYLFAVAEGTLGPWATVAFFVLIVSSVFAALLAFHNSINRYVHAFAADGLLPRAMARTRARNGAPWVAGLIQTGLAALVVAGFALAGADPYLNLLIWVNTPGVVGIVVLQVLASIAVVVYFVRTASAARRGFVIVVGILAAVVMAAFTAVIVLNIGALTGASDAVNAVILAAVPLALITGVVIALVLRAVRPSAYARIGAQDQ
jgi:amino acid transporter